MTDSTPAWLAMNRILAVPEHRRDPLRELVQAIDNADSIALTTHVNADGDGAGSQAAIAGWLARRRKLVAITNPTGFPEQFGHLVADGVDVVDPGAAQDARVREADMVVVVDTGEPRRLGRVAKRLRDGHTAVMDHHPPAEDGISGPGLRDVTACATGELVYDLLVLHGEPVWAPEVVEGIYLAIETDTGSFRYSNTSARAHLIAADLIHRGVDPEVIYRRIYATVPLERIRMIRLTLETLDRDPELPITWLTVPRTVTHDMGATTEDLEGMAEYARNVEGTEVAITFRETTDGATKVSFRSNGDVDVNSIAKGFGGGGHVKASGAVIGGPVESVRPRVLDAVREAVRHTLGDAP